MSDEKDKSVARESASARLPKKGKVCAGLLSLILLCASSIGVYLGIHASGWSPADGTRDVLPTAPRLARAD